MKQQQNMAIDTLPAIPPGHMGYVSPAEIFSQHGCIVELAYEREADSYFSRPARIVSLTEKAPDALKLFSAINLNKDFSLPAYSSLLITSGFRNLYKTDPSNFEQIKNYAARGNPIIFGGTGTTEILQDSSVPLRTALSYALCANTASDLRNGLHYDDNTIVFAPRTQESEELLFEFSRSRLLRVWSIVHLAEEVHLGGQIDQNGLILPIRFEWQGHLDDVPFDVSSPDAASKLADLVHDHFILEISPKLDDPFADHDDFSDVVLSDETYLDLSNRFDHDFYRFLDQSLDVAGRKTRIEKFDTATDFYQLMRGIATFYAASVFEKLENDNPIPWLKIRLPRNDVPLGIAMRAFYTSDDDHAELETGDMKTGCVQRIIKLLIDAAKPECEAFVDVGGIRRSDYRTGAYTFMFLHEVNPELSAHDRFHLLANIRAALLDIAGIGSVEADHLISGLPWNDPVIDPENESTGKDPGARRVA